MNNMMDHWNQVWQPNPRGRLGALILPSSALRGGCSQLEPGQAQGEEGPCDQDTRHEASVCKSSGKSTRVVATQYNVHYIVAQRFIYI